MHIVHVYIYVCKPVNTSFHELTLRLKIWKFEYIILYWSWFHDSQLLISVHFCTQQYVIGKPGNMIDVDSGRVLSQHQGIHTYTYAQSAHISGLDSKYYVCEIDASTNTLFLVCVKVCSCSRQIILHVALSSQFLKLIAHWIGPDYYVEVYTVFSNTYTPSNSDAPLGKSILTVIIGSVEVFMVSNC